MQWTPPHNAKITIKKSMNLKVVKTNVTATSIYIQNVVSKKPILENIIVISSNNNMLNFRPTALSNGSFKVDFGEKIDISDIVLVTGKSPCNYITNLDINLYETTCNGEMKVWEYSGPLLDQSENTIHISKMYYNPSKSDVEFIEKSDTCDKKLIINENEFAVSLMENDEKYVSH